MKNRKKWVVTAIIMFLVLSIFGGIFWFNSQRTISTDNAYIHSEITIIAPKVAGYIVEVPINDNTIVTKNSLLFRIDESDYVAKLAQAKANVQAAKAKITNVEVEMVLQHSLIHQSEAQISAALATQKYAYQEYDRQLKLRKVDATTEQKYESTINDKAKADADLTIEQANYDIQKGQLDVLTAQLLSAQAELAQSEATYTLASQDLDNCHVYAPIDGVVGNRKVNVGKYVTPGMTSLSLVPLQDVWVVANVKETQLESIRIGQKVLIEIDGYPHTTLTGTVNSFSPGSGSAFSLLPPDNATGNFVRVVQRVPVKIIIDDNKLQGLLVPGISAKVTIFKE